MNKGTSTEKWKELYCHSVLFYVLFSLPFVKTYIQYLVHDRCTRSICEMRCEGECMNKIMEAHLHPRGTDD